MNYRSKYTVVNGAQSSADYEMFALSQGQTFLTPSVNKQTSQNKYKR